MNFMFLVSRTVVGDVQHHRGCGGTKIQFLGRDTHHQSLHCQLEIQVGGISCLHRNGFLVGQVAQLAGCDTVLLRLYVLEFIFSSAPVV